MYPLILYILMYMKYQSRIVIMDPLILHILMYITKV